MNDSLGKTMVAIYEPEENEEVNKCFIEILLTCFVEIASFLDFVTDFFILKALAYSRDTCWFAVMLFTMVSPYFTLYGTLLKYLMDHIKDSINESKFHRLNKLICHFLTAPSMCLFLILIDSIFMISSVIVYPILLLFSFSRYGNPCLETF